MQAVAPGHVVRDKAFQRQSYQSQMCATPQTMLSSEPGVVIEDDASKSTNLQNGFWQQSSLVGDQQMFWYVVKTAQALQCDTCGVAGMRGTI